MLKHLENTLNKKIDIKKYNKIYDIKSYFEIVKKYFQLEKKIKFLNNNSKKKIKLLNKLSTLRE